MGSTACTQPDMSIGELVMCPAESVRSCMCDSSSAHQHDKSH